MGEVVVDGDTYVDTKTAAEIAGVSTTTILRWAAGGLPSIRVGRSYAVLKSALDGRSIYLEDLRKAGERVAKDKRERAAPGRVALPGSPASKEWRSQRPRIVPPMPQPEQTAPPAYAKECMVCGAQTTTFGGKCFMCIRRER